LDKISRLAIKYKKHEKIHLTFFAFVFTFYGYSQCFRLNPVGVNFDDPISYDLNNDGIYDIMVHPLIRNGAQFFKILCKNGSKIETDGNYFAVAYNPGVTLGVNLYEDSALLSSPNIPQGVRKFIGLKVINNGQLCCAWLDIQYSKNATPAIMFGDGNPNGTDVTHCCSTSPNVCLKAGEAGTPNDIQKVYDFNNAIVLYLDSKITIDTKNIRDYNISIVDIFGNQLYEAKNINGLINIEAANFPKQNLFVVLSEGENRAKRKVFRVSKF
jgi:hypothetical protein